MKSSFDILVHTYVLAVKMILLFFHYFVPHYIAFFCLFVFHTKSLKKISKKHRTMLKKASYKKSNFNVLLEQVRLPKIIFQHFEKKENP